MPNKSFDTATRADGEEVYVTIDGERFDATPIAPANAILKVGALAASDKPQDKVEAVTTFLDSVLLPDSRQRFADRMGDPERPISIDTCGQVVAYLMEVYTGRPPGEPSPSQ